VRGPAISGAPPPRIVSQVAVPVEDSPASEPRLYHSSSFDRASQELIDGITRREGLLILVGESGTGKTTLCQAVIRQLGRRTVTAFIARPAVSFDDLMRQVLVEFGVASEDRYGTVAQTPAGPALTRAIGDFAASLAPLRASAVLIVDEAEKLTAEVLEPLVKCGDAPSDERRVQIVLVGRPELSSTIERLPEVERRIVHRIHLEPLESYETAAYVAQRMSGDSDRPRVEIDAGALAEIHARTGGVPRVIDLLSDRALARGYESSAAAIDEAVVADAAAELALDAGVSRGRRILQVVLNVLAFLGLVLAGAAAAAWILREDFTRLINSL
jgi:general secretion pathway protein A